MGSCSAIKLNMCAASSDKEQQKSSTSVLYEGKYWYISCCIGALNPTSLHNEKEKQELIDWYISWFIGAFKLISPDNEKEKQELFDWYISWLISKFYKPARGGEIEKQPFVDAFIRKFSSEFNMYARGGETEKQNYVNAFSINLKKKLYKYNKKYSNTRRAKQAFNEFISRLPFGSNNKGFSDEEKVADKSCIGANSVAKEEGEEKEKLFENFFSALYKVIPRDEILDLKATDLLLKKGRQMCLELIQIKKNFLSDEAVLDIEKLDQERQICLAWESLQKIKNLIRNQQALATER